MDYGRDYSIYEMARVIKRYHELLNEININYFNNDSLRYDRIAIQTTIQASLNLPGELVPITSHPAIHSAMKNIESYESKSNVTNLEEINYFSHEIYDQISWLVGFAENLIVEDFKRMVEKIIEKNGGNYGTSIKELTVELQKDGYNSTHPKGFLMRYRTYIKKRVSDLKELMEIDTLSIGIELKEITFRPRK